MLFPADRGQRWARQPQVCELGQKLLGLHSTPGLRHWLECPGNPSEGVGGQSQAQSRDAGMPHCWRDSRAPPLTSSAMEESGRRAPFSSFWVILDWMKSTTSWLLITFLQSREVRKAGKGSTHSTASNRPSSGSALEEGGAVMPQRHNSSLPTHQIPSQAMIMKSWSSFIVSTLMSGKAEIICSSGGRFLFRL